MEQAAFTAQDRRQQEHQERYANAYRMYLCDRSDLPLIQTVKVGLPNQTRLALSPALHLEIRLGKAIDPTGNMSRLRTETRYILRASPGKELGRGEGKITKDVESEHSPTVRFDPATLCVEVHEELSGAGDLSRHIVFMPEPGAPADANGVPSRWQVLYVNLPQRGNAYGGEGDQSHHHGVSNGKIYVEVDGKFYAFPVEKYHSSRLEFGLG